MVACSNNQQRIEYFQISYSVENTTTTNPTIMDQLKYRIKEKTRSGIQQGQAQGLVFCP